MVKEYYLTNSRFKFIALLLMIIWIGTMTLIYMKGEALSTDPCGSCAKLIGENIICSAKGVNINQRTYYPNGSIYNSKQESLSISEMVKLIVNVSNNLTNNSK